MIARTRPHTGLFGTLITLSLLSFAATPGVAAVTSGFDFFVDASQDDGLNNRWEDLVAGNPSGSDFELVGGVNHVLATTAFGGITHAYDFVGGATGNSDGALLSATGTSNGRSFQNSTDGDWTNESVSIEMWFKPDDLTPTPTNGQILFEDGGGTGFGFFVDNNELRLRKAGGSGNVAFDISGLATDFIQAVGTFNGGNIELFINGDSKGTANPGGGDWSGGDNAGVGTRGGSNTGGIGGGQSNTESFDGQIAMFRVYRNQVLTPQEVQDNFDAIVAPPGATLTWDAGGADGSWFDATWDDGGSPVAPTGGENHIIDNGATVTVDADVTGGTSPTTVAVRSSSTLDIDAGFTLNVDNVLGATFEDTATLNMDAGAMLTTPRLSFTSGTTATIGAGSTVTVSDTLTVANLLDTTGSTLNTAGAAVIVSNGGTLTADNAFQADTAIISGTANLNAGGTATTATLNGTGALNGTDFTADTFNAAGGTAGLSGTLEATTTVNVTADTDLSSSTIDFDAATANLDAVLTFDQDLLLGELNVNSGGNAAIGGNTLTTTTASGGSGALNVTGGDLTTSGDVNAETASIDGSWTVNNAGSSTVTVNSGGITDGGNSTLNVDGNPAATFALGGGTINVDTLRFTNAGAITTAVVPVGTIGTYTAGTGTTLSTEPTVSAASNLSVEGGGTANVNHALSDLSVAGAGSQLNVQTPALNFNNLTVSDGTANLDAATATITNVTQSGGTINVAPNSLTVDTLNVSGGVFNSGTASTTVTSSASIAYGSHTATFSVPSSSFDLRGSDLAAGTEVALNMAGSTITVATDNVGDPLLTNDAGGSVPDGTPVGGGPTPAAGVFNGGANSDGSQAATWSDIPEFENQQTVKSIFAWVKPGDIATGNGNNRITLWEEGGGTNDMGFFLEDDGNGNITAIARMKNGGNNTTVNSSVLPTGGSNDGFQHVGLVYDASANGGNGELTVYVNGAVDTQAGSSVPQVSSHSDDAGFLATNNADGFGNNTNPTYTGDVDEFYIFNTALSDTDVADLFTTNGQNVTSTPVLHLSFDQFLRIVDLPEVSFDIEQSGTIDLDEADAQYNFNNFNAADGVTLTLDPDGSSVSAIFGGTVSVGNSPGQATVDNAGNAAFGLGDTVVIEFEKDLTGADLLTVTGDLMLTETGTIAVLTDPTLLDETETIIDVGGDILGLPSGGTQALTGWIVNGAPGYTAGILNGDLVISSQPVPEPSTLALLALGVVGLAWLRRRTR